MEENQVITTEVQTVDASTVTQGAGDTTTVQNTETVTDGQNVTAVTDTQATSEATDTLDPATEAAYEEDIQELYLAYYDRPADEEGLEYWTEELQESNGSLDKIIEAFSNSAEAGVKYGGKSQEALIKAVYNSMLNRDPDLQGLEYFAAQLESGKITPGKLVLAVLNGAQNGDVQTIKNKVKVATEFTEQLEADASKSAEYKKGTKLADIQKLLAGVSAESDADDLEQIIADSVECVAGDTATTDAYIAEVTGKSSGKDKSGGNSGDYGQGNSGSNHGGGSSNGHGGGKKAPGKFDMGDEAVTVIGVSSVDDQAFYMG